MSDTNEVHAMVVRVLDKTGYRPHGHDGSAWEHPNGTRVTTGYSGGQVRVRRFVPGNHRFERIPPVVWDVKGTPDESEIAEFVGQRGPAPVPTSEESIRLAQIEAAAEAPESLRQRVIEEIDCRMNDGFNDAEGIADAVLAIIRGEA